MDKRKMKKKILSVALSEYESLMRQRKSDGAEDFEIGVMILDKDEEDVTEAQKRRFWQTLQEMVDNADSKLD